MESVYECVLSVVSCSLRASEALRKLPTEKWGFLLEIARSNKIAPFKDKNHNARAFESLSNRLAQRLTPSHLQYVFDTSVDTNLEDILIEIKIPFSDVKFQACDTKQGLGMISNVYMLCTNYIYHQVNASEEDFEKPVVFFKSIEDEGIKLP